MRRREPRGTLLEQKRRHAARQRLFDAVRSAKIAPTTFVFCGCRVRSRPEWRDGTHAIVAIRRGYALVEIGEDLGKCGHVLASQPRVRALRNGFALDHVVVWCELLGRAR